MPLIGVVLEGRWEAAAVRVEELEAELVRVGVDLADAEGVLRCRAIGLEQFLEAPADEEQPAEMAAVFLLLGGGWGGG
ncbi:hypothetical protein M8J74_29625, partial [Streptomyces panaciradicis]|nr:hypothetical protein [Streptomyces panaciradicis]